MENDDIKKEKDLTSTIDKIISRDTKRVRLLKRITIVSWILLVLLFILFALIEAFSPKISPIYPIDDILFGRGYPVGAKTTFEAVLIMALPIGTILIRAVFIIAIFLSVSLYIRSRTLTIRQINRRLVRIEEQLKRIINVNGK